MCLYLFVVFALVLALPRCNALACPSLASATSCFFAYTPAGDAAQYIRDAWRGQATSDVSVPCYVPFARSRLPLPPYGRLGRSRARTPCPPPRSVLCGVCPFTGRADHLPPGLRWAPPAHRCDRRDLDAPPPRPVLSYMHFSPALPHWRHFFSTPSRGLRTPHEESVALARCHQRCSPVPPRVPGALPGVSLAVAPALLGGFRGA